MMTPALQRAILAAAPEAILVGVEALRRDAWATQVAHQFDVAILDSERPSSILGCLWRPRPAAWREAARAGLAHPRDGLTLPWLRPAWALADLLAYEREGHRFGGLDPDDVEPVDVGDLDRADWSAACAAFGLDATREAAWLANNGSTALF